MTIAAVRFNNPGNVSLPIQGWAGGGSIVGIAGQPGYASFPSMQIGYAAFLQRVANYIDVKGLDTIHKLNSVYATDPSWGAGVAAICGIGLNEKLVSKNADQMTVLGGAIIKHETGMTYAELGIAAGPSSTPTASIPPATSQGSSTMGSLLASLLGNSVIAGWLRTAVVGALVAASQSGKLPGGVDYSGLVDALSVLFVGLWSHVAKTVDPPVSAVAAKA